MSKTILVNHWLKKLAALEAYFSALMLGAILIKKYSCIRGEKISCLSGIFFCVDVVRYSLYMIEKNILAFATEKLAASAAYFFVLKLGAVIYIGMKKLFVHSWQKN